MISTIIARAMSRYAVKGSHYCYYAISSGSLILQLPGGQFIKELLDLLKGDITNGTTKLIQAIADTTLLGAGLGAGVAMLPNEFNSTLSNSTSDAARDLPTLWDPQAMPVWIVWVRLFPAIIFSLALAIFFWSEKQQFRRDIGPQATIAFICYSVSFGLSYVKSLAVIHAATGPFTAGILSYVWGHWNDQDASDMVETALLVLAPGTVRAARDGGHQLQDTTLLLVTPRYRRIGMWHE